MTRNKMIVKVNKTSYRVDYYFLFNNVNEACPEHGHDCDWVIQKRIISIFEIINVDRYFALCVHDTPRLWKKIVDELKRIETVPFCNLCSL